MAAAVSYALAPSPPLSTVIAVLGMEMDHVNNRLGQVGSFKDALDSECVCDVAHVMEMLFEYLKQIEGGAGAPIVSRQHLAVLPSASLGSSPASEMPGQNMASSLRSKGHINAFCPGADDGEGGGEAATASGSGNPPILSMSLPGP